METEKFYKVIDDSSMWDGKVVRIEDDKPSLPFGLTGKAIIVSFVEFPDVKRVVLKESLKLYKGKLPEIVETDDEPFDYILSDCVEVAEELYRDDWELMAELKATVRLMKENGEL